MVVNKRPVKRIRYHGNWGGPNWTAGQAKPTSELTEADRAVPAIDDFDQTCKDHDIDLHDATTAEEVQAANKRFIERAASQGFKGTAAAILVALGGPSQPNLPSSDNMPRGRLRGGNGRIRPYPTRTQADLPTYEELEAEEGADQLTRDVTTALELDRQEEEDRSIRNVLLNARGIVEDDHLVISAGQQQQEDDSFFDSTDSAQVTPDDAEPMPHTVENEGMDVEDTPAETSARIIGPQRASNPSGYTTRIASIEERFPFRQTEQAILEHHGSVSLGRLLKAGSNSVLRIRMNTFLTPYNETSGTFAAQSNYSYPIEAWSPQVLGRYVSFPASDGSYMDVLYHRNLGAFNDVLFPNLASDPKVAGQDYYNAHYRAYTVTKTEWMIRVELPYHCMKSMANEVAPTPAQVMNGLIPNTEWSNTPQCSTAARVFTHYTMTGDTITGVNPPTNANVLDMERWNNAYDNKVTVPINGVRVLRGTWYPGKVKHNPVNDADIETWTPIGSVPGQGHLEHLVVQFKERANTNSDSNWYIGCNISINLKYHVQFKERITEVQFPVRNQTNPAGTAVNNLVLQNVGLGTTYPV